MWFYAISRHIVRSRAQTMTWRLSSALTFRFVIWIYCWRWVGMCLWWRFFGADGRHRFPGDCWTVREHSFQDDLFWGYVRQWQENIDPGQFIAKKSNGTTGFTHPGVAQSCSGWHYRYENQMMTSSRLSISMPVVPFCLWRGQYKCGLVWDLTCANLISMCAK